MIKFIKSLFKREPKSINDYVTKQNELCLMLDNLQNNVLKGVK
jgi:hypothetical protein